MIKSGKQLRAEKKASRAKARKQDSRSENHSVEIEAFSQVSRFHTETLETLSNDIDLKGVCINVGNKVILEDANLRLFKGVKYGLIGLNGVGKSTLLKSIGYKFLVGFPSNIRVLYVEQLEDANQESSVVDVVLESDREGNRLREQANLLEKSLETGNVNVLTRCINEINLQNARAREQESRDIAARRSGARGATARRVLNEMEELTASAEQLQLANDPNPDAAVEAQSMLDNINIRLNAGDSQALRSKAQRLLSGLGIDKTMQEGSLSKLSGGWRLRASLASALLIQPDLLLLDEPTNHLDLPAIIWLEGYLKTLEDVTVLVVSHDRTFLNQVTTETIVMRETQLKYYMGNYDEYLKNFNEKQKHLKELTANIEKKQEAVRKAVQKNIADARKSGDDKKMAQMASRQRKIEDRGVGSEKNEKGFKFKRSKDAAGFHEHSRIQISVESEDSQPNWSIPNPEPLRNHKDLVTINDVFFKYPESLTYTLKSVSMSVAQDARIGIVGANGQGKSTLIKLICEELLPTNGIIDRHSSATIGYFAQQHIDNFYTQSIQSAVATPLSLIQDEHPEVKEQHARNTLGRFGIKGNTALQPIQSLSGGQMVRVAFAICMALKPAHLLVLDEPTNHLDFLTIEALIDALSAYDGAVLIVSHDQRFIEKTTKKLYMVDNSSVTDISDGGMVQYVKMVKSRQKSKKR